MRELSPGAEIGGYRIEAVVGRGGMGVVYRARQRRPQRTVALKVIAPELADDDHFRARFERESDLAARIEHPNVIPVHEIGGDDDLFYIVMRYVEGDDLRAFVAREGRLAPARAAGIVAQVGAALDAAHAHGLVHRDVKPGNVLIARAGADEHAYLTDFGLVKLLGSETSGMTATGAFVGTLGYLAPEQLEGRADARSDVYALGGVLYNALTGQPPYPQPTPAAKMWAQVNAPPPTVSEAVPEATAFNDVVARAMAKAPEERYPSAGDLGRAALAAAKLRDVPEPDAERTVARGEAAPAEAVVAPTDDDMTVRESAPVTVRDREPRAGAVYPDRRAGGGQPRGRRGRALTSIATGLMLLLVVGGVVAVVLSDGSSGKDDVPKESKSEPRAAAPPERPTPTSVRLRVVPSEPVYACVDDGRGRILFEGTVDKTRTFRAKRVRLNLGRSSAALSVNGEPVRYDRGPASAGFDFTPSRTRLLPTAQRPCT